MKEKGNFLKILHLFHYRENGFTFLELMAMLTNLGNLAGLATLDVGRFSGYVTGEVKAADKHRLQKGTAVYFAKGNAISKPFTVIPFDHGVLDPYLTGNSKNSWVIDVDGNVTYAGNSRESGGIRK
jgi:hypothetical protein